MKRIVVLIMVLAVLAVPMAATAQTTTNTAFQVVNLSQTDAANINITFYDTSGAEVYTMADVISASGSTTYIQSQMGGLGDTFNGSVVVSSDQEIAAIVNQNTNDGSNTAGYNGSYTGFSTGSTTFVIPIVLSSFYTYHTEISVQNAGDSPVNVTVDYVDTACTDDTASNLAVGTAVRFNNETSCGGVFVNTSATITADGPVVAIVNQITESNNQEQTYNGFAPADGNDVLYGPIMLKGYYGFNSAFQVQNVSGAPMDITATYSDGEVETVTGVPDGASATFIQQNENHADGWTGSVQVTNSTGGAMVGIVNQQGARGAASYNMYAGGSQTWALPSLLYKYYGFTSAFQVQNISGGPVDITITYDDGTSNSASGVADGDVVAFIQDLEGGHTSPWAGSARVEADGDIVIVVNQDVLTQGVIDFQYSYNAVPLQ